MSGSNPSRNSPATNKMLIDATHPEETRVVVLRQGRVEEFDYESAARKLLRGNIYLAKVTRVEPSLQAAFVDYGGNRHGFLAFNEIHPDYYQIPIADRRALIEAEAAAEAAEEEEEEREVAEAARKQRRGRNRRSRGPRQSEEATAGEERALDVTHLLPSDTGDTTGDGDDDTDRGAAPRSVPEAAASGHDDGSDAAADRDSTASDQPQSLPERIAADPTLYRAVEADTEHGAAPETTGAWDPEASRDTTPADAGSDDRDFDTRSAHHTDDRDTDDHDTDRRDTRDLDADDRGDEHREDAPRAVGLVEDEGVTEVDSDSDSDAENGNGEPEQVETVADADALEEVPYRPRRRLRSYKIQEVIKRRQVILIQVVKEERGTKGAALTTYLSLAGRYTVLMPNTARGGGISRKITNAQDRKRLKEIASELDVPEGMGLIIRTAGASRTKQEIKRDYDYLLRLWESVRELAISSNAPTLVYEEGNLIKRSIRDLYGKEVDEVVVAGETAYREAKDFMRMLMPSHAKNVIPYADPEPLFSRYQIERQLNAMFSPYVNLRSGGYLVINQTEALVSIDINSGKSTREFSIEETAVSTNLEAADEIARQLKLRDLAGLIVIDFIDMEEKRNNRNVERRLKDALRFDRARIQVGHISHFGLLEMSRQRLRTGVLEGSTSQCPHCQGTGVIRSTESVALGVLRGLEDALMTGQPASLVASTTAMVALYILNHKRPFINDMEKRYGITIHIQASDKLQGANFSIERQARRDDQVPARTSDRAVNMGWGYEDDDAEAPRSSAGAGAGADETAESGDGEQGDGRRRRRRRRRGRRDDQPGHSSHLRDDDQRHAGDDAADDDASEAPTEINGHVHDEYTRDEAGSRDDHDDDDGSDEARAAGDEPRGEGADDRRGRRGRRRGRRGGRRGQERDRGGFAGASATDGDGDSPTVSDPDSDQPDEHAQSEAPFADDRGGYRHSHDDEPAGDAAPAHRASPSSSDFPAYRAAEAAAPVAYEPEAAPYGYAARTEEAEPVEPEPARLRAEPIPVDAPPAMAASALPEPDDTDSAPQPAAASTPNPRTEPVASEPVLERVVVGGSSEPQAEADDSRPARRGWWQRR